MSRSRRSPSPSACDVAPTSSVRLRLSTAFATALSFLAILIGFLLALGYTLITAYDEVTATHCGVNNWLPSFSAVIGHSHVTATLWRIGVCINFPVRVATALLYYKWHANAPPVSQRSFPGSISLQFTARNRSLMAISLCASILAENVALLLLSFVSSNDNGPFHEAAFITFLVAATAGMALQVLLCSLRNAAAALPGSAAASSSTSLDARASGIYTSISPTYPPSSASAAGDWDGADLQDQARGCRSLQLKRRLLCAWLLLLVAAAVLFVRHNSHCEAGVYSLFAVAEYAIVGVNMCFHATVTLDWPDGGMSIESR